MWNDEEKGWPAPEQSVVPGRGCPRAAVHQVGRVGEGQDLLAGRTCPARCRRSLSRDTTVRCRGATVTMDLLFIFEEVGSGGKGKKMSTTKTSWPEVMGWPAAQAVSQIATDRPDVAIEVLPSGTSVTPGFSSERVRVFFDGTGSVAATPVVG
ncbi:hypothetical protein ACQ4PT_040246 [Festuca glaucescens]